MIVGVLGGDGGPGHEGEGRSEIGEAVVAADRPFRGFLAPFGQGFQRFRPFLVAQRHCLSPHIPSMSLR